MNELENLSQTLHLFTKQIYYYHYFSASVKIDSVPSNMSLSIGIHAVKYFLQIQFCECKNSNRIYGKIWKNENQSIFLKKLSIILGCFVPKLCGQVEKKLKKIWKNGHIDLQSPLSTVQYLSAQMYKLSMM